MDVPVYHLENVVRSSQEMEDFDGPLDLILALLEKNKMEIRDIQISLILEQYLNWMNRRRELDMEVASEFITMASQLVYIKTRMLLSVRDEETATEMDELIASLEAHRRHENYDLVRQVLPELERKFRIGRDYITRSPELLPKDSAYRHVHQTEDLTHAMLQILERRGRALPPPVQAFRGIVGHEPYSLQDKLQEVLSRVLCGDVAHFRALFSGNRSRSEVVATFLAVLELCKLRRIRLTGSDADCIVVGTARDDELPESVDVDTY